MAERSWATHPRRFGLGGGLMTSRTGRAGLRSSSSADGVPGSKRARRDPALGGGGDGDDEGGGGAAADGNAGDDAAPAARAGDVVDDDDDDDLPPGGGGRARVRRGWLQDESQPPSDLATRTGVISEIERELKRRGVSCGGLPKELKRKQGVLAERLTALWRLTGDDKRVSKEELENLPSKEMCEHLSMEKLYELIHLREGHQVAEGVNKKKRVEILHGATYKPAARGAARHRRKAKDDDGASATGGAASTAAQGGSARRTRGRQPGTNVAARDGASALPGAAAQAAMNQQTEQIAHSVFKMNTKVADKGEYVLLFVPEGSQVRVRRPSFVSPRERS